VEYDLAGSTELTQREYELFRQLVYAQSGINLGGEKLHLVRARLGKRLRVGRFESFKEYYEYVLNDKTGEELARLLDAISTNTTHFYREKRHFELLTRMVEEHLKDADQRSRTLRIWSAGCSSGEEPYSIAMTVHNLVKNRGKVEVKILATDLSVQMLSQAKLGIYEALRLGTLPPTFAHSYFTACGGRKSGQVQVVPEIRKLITFARFNLMQQRFPFKYPFDAIFCRNVMIYFDRPTQQELVARFHDHLKPGGLLLIGHSESLNAIKHSYHYVEPAVYRK
jgi:chemotaxis protein methyltransferase CheR